MRTTNTFSVLFWADQKNAKNNDAIIYARVTVNQKRVNISIKRKVSIDLWDKKKKKARGNSSEARQINQYLTQVNSQLFQCYQDLKFKGDLCKIGCNESAFIVHYIYHKYLLQPSSHFLKQNLLAL